jgi:hypothetical protein
MRTLRALILPLVLLALAGCTTWGPGGVPHQHRDGYTVTVPSGWTFHPAVGGELFATRDGVVLQQLTVRQFTLPHKLQLSKREIKPGLGAYELAEIFADEGRSDRKLARFTVSAQAAVKIGGLAGVRYDYAYVTEDGLRLSARRWLVPRGGKLWMATYLAPSRHYHERDLASVTAAIESVRFTAPPSTR